MDNRAQRSIWKVDVPIDDGDTEIDVPYIPGAVAGWRDEKTLVAAGITNNTADQCISVWFNAVSGNHAEVKRYTVSIYGTGHPMPVGARHLFTVVDPIRPPLVWHVMDVTGLEFS